MLQIGDVGGVPRSCRNHYILIPEYCGNTTVTAIQITYPGKGHG